MKKFMHQAGKLFKMICFKKKKEKKKDFGGKLIPASQTFETTENTQSHVKSSPISLGKI